MSVAQGHPRQVLMKRKRSNKNCKTFIFKVKIQLDVLLAPCRAEQESIINHSSFQDFWLKALVSFCQYSKFCIFACFQDQWNTNWFCLIFKNKDLLNLWIISILDKIDWDKIFLWLLKIYKIKPIFKAGDRWI